MNAVKRLLAIALALILSLTTLALPAMAVEITDEEIAPYALWGYCPKCAEMAKCTDRSEFGLRRSDAACPLGSSPKVHTHCDETIVQTWDCSNCGMFSRDGATYRYCVTFSSRY